MKALALILAALALTGCAAPAPEYARYAECTLPVTRDAGQGVSIPGCAAWTFGPTKLQRKDFAQRTGSRVIR